MSILDDNREKRADAILTYYAQLTAYNDALEEDGTDITTDKPQDLYKATNDLIGLFHDELKIILGYSSASQAYLISEEGPVDTSVLWDNANPLLITAALFNTEILQLINDTRVYMGNSTTSPYKRNFYCHWNQHDTIIGSYDDFGWKNVASKTSYTDAQNPFSTGANFKMAEPLEWYGDSGNLQWGNIVYDGLWSYRSTYIGNTSFTDHDATGFYNYTRSGASIENFLNPGVPEDLPSPYEIFKNTYWGTGDNTFVTSNTVYAHSGSDSGTFKIDDGATALLSTGWHAIYSNAVASEGWVVNVTFIADIGSGPVTGHTYTYDSANWPIPGIGYISGSRIIYRNPKISDDVKTGTVPDGRRNIWGNIYTRYYNANFKPAVDSITTSVEAWIAKLQSIIDYNQYSKIPNDKGKYEATLLIVVLNNWLTSWKSLTGETVAGATYTVNDAKWSDTAMNNLIISIKELISFPSGYGSSQTGIIPDRKTDLYNNILGEYILGSDEIWFPTDDEQFLENNTGDFTAGTLNYYRHAYVDARLSRESGTLVKARGGYYISLEKLAEARALEVPLAAEVADNKYDVTPFDLEISLDEEESVILGWEDIKAASSYDIYRKESLDGSYTLIQQNYGYVDPGDPPDGLLDPPLSEYEDPALTKGSQMFGLIIGDIDDSPGLNDDFTIYDFKLTLDSGAPVFISIKGLDCKTWDSFSIAIQQEFDELEVEATIELVDALSGPPGSKDFEIISNKKGNGSTVLIESGTTNNLLSALGTTPEVASPGITVIEQGKVYYYLLRLNNGYLVTLGDGTESAKDWGSQSEFQTVDYSNSIALHGDMGTIVWDTPVNLTATGVDPGLNSPSDLFCTLEWDEIPNADIYKIYRATSLDGGYAYIDSTSNVFYDDTTGIPGFVYYYKVQGIASFNDLTFDDEGNLSDPIETLLTDSGVRGKKLWQTITLEASREDPDGISLLWNSLSGANGYVVYTSPIEEGQYSYISEDDATETIVTSTSYTDETPSRQFFEREFTSPTDGLAESEYSQSTRYYFILVSMDEDFNSTVKQYHIDSPVSGIWASQDIADSIQTAIVAGLDDAVCELVSLANPEAHFKIRFTTKVKGTKSSILLVNGTFGISLLEILNALTAEPGGGSYTAVEKFYKVKAVEIVDDEIVRSSEFSNVAAGLRPISLTIQS